MFLVFVPILNSLSCSAPEVAPPTRKLSPAEKEGRGQNNLDSNSSNKEMSSAKIDINEDINEDIKEKNKDTSNDQDVLKSTKRTTDSPEIESQEEPMEDVREASIDTDSANQALEEGTKISMLQAPFTAWTNQPTSILNPQGKPVLELKKIGVRLEIQKISYGFAQVICSGCQEKSHNHAGWISLDFISTYTVFRSQQMKDFLLWRSDISTQDSIEDMESITFCKAIDAGFENENANENANENSNENSVLLFQKFSISSHFSNQSIRILEDESELQGWGCGVKKAKIDE
jgi:hypothetical protein